MRIDVSDRLRERPAVAAEIARGVLALPRTGSRRAGQDQAAALLGALGGAGRRPRRARSATSPPWATRLRPRRPEWRSPRRRPARAARPVDAVARLAIRV